MTIVTHVLATTLGVQAFELHGSEAVLAYVFGVGVDVDHAVKLPFYLRAGGLKNRRRSYSRASLPEAGALSWLLPLFVFLPTIFPAARFPPPPSIVYGAVSHLLPFFTYSSP